VVTDPAASAASAQTVGSGPDAAARTGPIAVVVLSHRAPDQVARLASRLQDGSDVVVAIHHDPNGEPLRLRTSSSVALVPDPVRAGILLGPGYFGPGLPHPHHGLDPGRAGGDEQ